jgi:hypothetical protein
MEKSSDRTYKKPMVTKIASQNNAEMNCDSPGSSDADYCSTPGNSASGDCENVGTAATFCFPTGEGF